MNKNEYYGKIAQTIIARLKSRQIQGYYCDSKEDARKKALELITEGNSVGWGGSQTIKDIGLMEVIQNGPYVVYDRKKYSNKQEKMEMYAHILQADWFLMSTNAITMNGEMINIDGRSDRISFLCFGPENVLIVAGMNKVVPDVESGIKRSQNVAAPKNAMKLERKGPCRDSGECTACLSPECICSQILITRRSAYKNRIKVILVGEELGF